MININYKVGNIASRAVLNGPWDIDDDTYAAFKMVDKLLLMSMPSYIMCFTKLNRIHDIRMSTWNGSLI